MITSTPTAPAILGYSRTTGEPVALVPSSSEPNICHVVTMDGRCSCKGFAYRGHCRHIASTGPLPCTGCRNFHLTDADRLKAHPDARRELADGGAAHLQVLRAAGAWS